MNSINGESFCRKTKIFGNIRSLSEMKKQGRPSVEFLANVDDCKRRLAWCEKIRR